MSDRESWFHVPVQLRFRDIDALGHVNNAAYLTLMELARVEFGQRQLGWARIEDTDFVVARIEIDYRRPILLEDRLELALQVVAVGRTSFTLDYRFLVDGVEAARARSVQVFVGPGGTGGKQPVPPDFVARLGGFHASGLDRGASRPAAPEAMDPGRGTASV